MECVQVENDFFPARKVNDPTLTLACGQRPILVCLARGVGYLQPIGRLRVVPLEPEMQVMDGAEDPDFVRDANLLLYLAPFVACSSLSQ